jgi:AraC-like DNA-binding protein
MGLKWHSKGAGIPSGPNWRYFDAFSKSPMALVNHVRLERVTKMLLTGHTSIEQVGKSVGFSSRSHFSQAFKKHTGFSPASYKNG